MDDARSRLRTTFNQDAALYHQARPGYPAAMFDDVVALSGIPEGGRVLEIGPGTGQVTLPLARRGYSILAIELGAHMAAMARQNLAEYLRVDIQVDAFEGADIPPAAFDLVISATAFHWIDPAVRYHKVAAALKPGGALALCWNKHVQSPASRGFFEATKPIYNQAFPEDAWEDLQEAHELLPTERLDLEQSGLFGPVAVREYMWEQEYTARSYVDVLNTYSNHRDLPEDARQRLFDGVADLINTGYGGRITKGYMTLLLVAQVRK